MFHLLARINVAAKGRVARPVQQSILIVIWERGKTDFFNEA